MTEHLSNLTHKMFKGFFIILLFFMPGYTNAQTGAGIVDFEAIKSFQLFNVGQQKNISVNTAAKPLTAFVFLSPECPLCKNYTKTLNELYQKNQQQLQLIGIIPGKACTLKDIQIFVDKYHIIFQMLVDEKEQLTHYLQATVTPQVVLVDDENKLIYTGAIDDWAQSLGKQKMQALQHYMEDAITQSLQSVTVKIKKTNPVGCKINDY